MSAQQKSPKSERKDDLLKRELEKLKTISNFGHHLVVAWIPDANSPLAGEVKGDVVFVYELDIEAALSTLQHEFFDYLVCSAIRPYQEVTIYYKTMFNSLLACFGYNPDGYFAFSCRVGIKDPAFDAFRILGWAV